MDRIKEIEERIWRTGRMLHEASIDECLEMIGIISQELTAGRFDGYYGKILFAIRFALATDRERQRGFITV